MSGASDSVPLREHLAALAEKDKEFDAERDRRYAEVKAEQEKALKIKEEADAKALDLASQISTYKEEKANELRSQIERERGEMATKEYVGEKVDKIGAEIKPLADYANLQRGRGAGLSAGWGYLVAVVTLLVGLSVLAAFLLAH